MSLIENKTTYGTAPVVDSGATKGSRRGVVVGLVRPRARKSIHTSPFGSEGFNSGMGSGFPFTGGDSIGWGNPAVNTGAGMTGPGGEHVGGYKTHGY